MKAYRWAEVQLYSFQTTALGGEWSASHSDCVTSGERTPLPHLIEALIGPKANIDSLIKKKTLLPLREIDPRFVGCSAHSLFIVPNGILWLLTQSAHLLFPDGILWFLTQSVRHLFPEINWSNIVMHSIKQSCVWLISYGLIHAILILWLIHTHTADNVAKVRFCNRFMR
jgi:hypothetical protein